MKTQVKITFKIFKHVLSKQTTGHLKTVNVHTQQ